MTEQTTVSFTLKQLKVIETALEAYTRMKAGQFKIAIQNVFPAVEFNSSLCDSIETLHTMVAKQGSFGDHKHSNAQTLSIMNPLIGDGQIAYEIKQTICQYLSVLANDGFFNDSFCKYDDPLKLTDEPLPVIHGWSKDKIVEITCDETNRNIHKHVQVGDFEKAWEYIIAFLDANKELGNSYTKTTRVKEGCEDVYEVVLYKPYRVK